MADEVLYELGVDINSKGTFVNGDIALCSYENNLIQAILNRLNTELDELDIFYYDYGSILTNFFGWRGNEETLRFMKSEIKKVLDDEPRLIGHESTLEYIGDGTTRINLILYPSTDVVIETNLVLRETGVIELEVDTNLNEEET